MPKPIKGEKQMDFMNRCVEQIAGKEGRPIKQAVAICFSIWGQEKRKK